MTRSFAAMTRRRPHRMLALALGALALIAPTPARAQDETSVYIPIVREAERPLTPISYTSFDGLELTLYPHMGSEIAFLVADPSLDSETMRQIVATLDAAWRFYANSTGREPIPYSELDGRGTIAVVPSTCGGVTFDCGYLGATGIEIEPSVFARLYNGVRDRDEYDSTLFHTMARNFWFYTDQIEYKGADNTRTVTNGYAAFMRIWTLNGTGVTPGPIFGQEFKQYVSRVEGLVDLYLADPTLSWENTLRIGSAPSNPHGLVGADLFAAFVFRLTSTYGDDFIAGLWQEVGARPAVPTTQEAVDNFVAAASTAAGADLTSLFRDEWRWPVK